MIVKKLKNRIRRFFNKKKLYIYPETNDGWIKSNIPLISSDDSSYFDPYCCKVNDSLKIYISRRQDNSIVCFDFVNEKLVNESIVLKPSLAGWDSIINRASVVFYNGKYYMWYTGQNNGKSQIGLAISDDGKKFVRHSDSPIIVPRLSFEKDSIMNPCVIYDKKNNVFKMWYSAGDIYEPDVICYAESFDGINWNKNLSPVFMKSDNKYDGCKVGGCDVIISNNTYKMYYIGYQNIDNARICMAKSFDGFVWERYKNNPIISPTKSSFDAHACYKPCYFVYNSFEYIVYNGRVNGQENICYAKKRLIKN